MDAPAWLCGRKRGREVEVLLNSELAFDTIELGLLSMVFLFLGGVRCVRGMRVKEFQGNRVRMRFIYLGPDDGTWSSHE